MATQPLTGVLISGEVNPSGDTLDRVLLVTVAKKDALSDAETQETELVTLANLPGTPTLQQVTDLGNITTTGASFGGDINTNTVYRLNGDAFAIKISGVHAFFSAINGYGVLKNDGSSYYFFIENSNGNVGIGTSTPAEKLDVVGAVKFDYPTIDSGGDSVHYFLKPLPFGAGNAYIFGIKDINNITTGFIITDGGALPLWYNGTSAEQIALAQNVVDKTTDQTIVGEKTFVDLTTFNFRIIAEDVVQIKNNGGLVLYNNGNTFSVSINPIVSLSADREVYFPDASGTVVLDSTFDDLAIAFTNSLTVINTTAVPLTKAALNSTYPTANIGFKVMCTNLNITYEKYDATEWKSIVSNVVS